MDSYSFGSGWSGDKLDFITPRINFSETTIFHELFHVFHFNLVPHLFSVPSFHSEGLAEVMTYEGVNDNYIQGNGWYFKEGLERFKTENGHYPNLAEVMESDEYMSVYSYGQAFWYWMKTNHTDYLTIKEFFTSGLDWGVFDISYEEIDAGYINYLKQLAGIQTDLPSIPSNPSPQDQATAVNTTPTLTWTNGSNTDQLDLYFGTNNPPTLKALSDASVISYQPSTLTYSTTYFWKVVNKNNNGNTEGPVWSFTTDVGTGIFDYEKDSELKIYPNPANDYVFINSPETVILRIFNISGQCVLEQRNFIEGRINVSDFDKGTYIVTFTNKNGRLTKQLIIK